MAIGWQYRLGSAAGVVCLTGGAVLATNHPLTQQLTVVIPVFNRLPATTLSNSDLSLAIATALVVVLGAVAPLFKPRPRRVLDTLIVAEKRVLVAIVALAAIGYFDYTYRLPRSTLALTGAVLAVMIPLWFVTIRWQPAVDAGRAIIVGDDPETIEDVLATTEMSVIGYVSPPGRIVRDRVGDRSIEITDGGQVVERRLTDLECLGGLSRLDEMLVGHNVDTAILAFARPDRAEFFGTLDTLYRHGVPAKVHRDHADTVLTTDVETGELVGIDLDPWDWQDYITKRAFDVVFAVIGLVALAPLMMLIAAVIKLDSHGPILYRQTRTAEFGGTFTVHKFRSMTASAEAGSGATISAEDAGGTDPRVTRVGHILRQTHLDELPQLWTILLGHMSVVGPRPERPELDNDMEADVGTWRRRWFVKPGLTGLAQINDATAYQPQEKLRYDVMYIRNQSFWFDLKIVIRQLWIVVVDVARLVV